MKALKRWKTTFSVLAAVWFGLAAGSWLFNPDYSAELTMKQIVFLVLAVVFTVASLVLEIVRKAIVEEREGD